MYVITDNTVFIKTSGGYQIVNNFCDAGTYKINKAKNIIKSMPSELRGYNWNVKCVTVCKNEIVDVSGETEFNYDLDYEIFKMEKFAKDLQEHEIYLIRKLQEVELKIVDLRHYVEFYNLDMYSSWKFYKLFQEVTRERRYLKDEMAKINYILNSNMKSAAKNNISNSVNRLNERQYSARVLIDLFNEKEMN